MLSKFTAISCEHVKAPVLMGYHARTRRYMAQANKGTTSQSQMEKKQIGKQCPGKRQN